MAERPTAMSGTHNTHTHKHTTHNTHTHPDMLSGPLYEASAGLTSEMEPLSWLMAEMVCRLAVHDWYMRSRAD